jgi:hypothetical protein
MVGGNMRNVFCAQRGNRSGRGGLLALFAWGIPNPGSPPCDKLACVTETAMDPMPLDLKSLTANVKAVDHLGGSFDLNFAIKPKEVAWFSVDGAESITQIARNGAGDVFAQLKGSSRVLYVSSEGAAGIVDDDLEAFITLAVACPYWHDVLNFSANGNLDEMRRAASVLELKIVDDEEMEEATAFLKSELGLPDLADPVGTLHRVVSGSNLIVRGPDGSPFGGLFNSLVINEAQMRRLYGL